MSVFRLLVVEDNEDELSVCRDTVARYIDETKRQVEIVECKSVNDSFEKLGNPKNSCDGAIIDLKLDDHGDEGNLVISRIKESNHRIPVAILTGTPNVADSDFPFIGVFKKGDPGAGYADLLDRFWEIYNTGLTHIMGSRGIIEKMLNTVFHKSLLPQVNQWVEYGIKDSPRTEKALLRHALSHLMQLLDDDDERYFPEEFYLAPSFTDNIRTGSIVNIKGKDENRFFIVMTPACDLVVRSSGRFKTERILLVEIENVNDVVGIALSSVTKTEKKKEKLKNVFKNNYTDYYHWLPKTGTFAGGFLNFRKLSTLTTDEFREKFQIPDIQISPSFVKDVVSRFSSYYARQGQPDIDCDNYIMELISTQESTG